MASQLARTDGASQLITVDAPSSGSTSATFEMWARSGSCWQLADGPWSSRLGYNGVSQHHHEGDGTTPAGDYGFGPTVYGIAANPGVNYSYHQLVCGDWWDEDPSSASYNTFQHVACGTTPPFGGGSEALWTETQPYQSFAVVAYNMYPPVSGAGSGIFVHDDVGGPTDGCVSLPAAELNTFLKWLQPSQHPIIVIGTDADIRSY